MARRRGIEGVVTVRLAIDAVGALEATSLVGRPPEILARSARDAVAAAGPFPPPPGGRLQVEFPVRYEIVD
jgi:TonB family protein